jgi:hypothetical protein
VHFVPVASIDPPGLTVSGSHVASDSMPVRSVEEHPSAVVMAPVPSTACSDAEAPLGAALPTVAAPERTVESDPPLLDLREESRPARTDAALYFLACSESNAAPRWVGSRLERLAAESVVLLVKHCRPACDHHSASHRSALAETVLSDLHRRDGQLEAVAQRVRS